jgi:hypothetical protein
MRMMRRSNLSVDENSRLIEAPMFMMSKRLEYFLHLSGDYACTRRPSSLLERSETREGISEGGAHRSDASSNCRSNFLPDDLYEEEYATLDGIVDKKNVRTLAFPFQCLLV